MADHVRLRETSAHDVTGELVTPDSGLQDRRHARQADRRRCALQQEPGSERRASRTSKGVVGGSDVVRRIGEAYACGGEGLVVWQRQRMHARMVEVILAMVPFGVHCVGVGQGTQCFKPRRTRPCKLRSRGRQSRAREG